MRRQSGLGALLAMVLNIRAKQIGELLLQGTLLGGLLRQLQTACTLICMPLLYRQLLSHLCDPALRTTTCQQHCTGCLQTCDCLADVSSHKLRSAEAPGQYPACRRKARMPADGSMCHADGLTRILKFNASTSSALQNSSSTGNGEAFKVLVLDKQTKDIIAPLLKISDLRKYGVTLHLMISTERQSIPDVPAIYFVDATEENIRLITNVRDCPGCHSGSRLHA